MRKTMELHARVHHEDGWYWAQVDALPSCFASGRTLDELREALAEAVWMVLDQPGEPPKGSVLEVEGMDVTVPTLSLQPA
jgi:predicted RNase H-like HicB family nuclease